MKKIALITLTVLSLAMVATIISSADEPTAEYHAIYDNCEIIIERSNLTDDQLSIIASELSGTTSTSKLSTRGLTCSLFGHCYENTIATKITHKKYSTSPRCLEERYLVFICSRCNEVTQTLQETSKIICCPNS